MCSSTWKGSSEGDGFSPTNTEVETPNPVTADSLGHLIASSYHLAISGPTFAVIVHEYPELVDQLCSVCDVFARMAPDQKQSLVEQLQQIDYTVAMCGDGANDCAALKAAHAGKLKINETFQKKNPQEFPFPTRKHQLLLHLHQKFRIFDVFQL